MVGIIIIKLMNNEIASYLAMTYHRAPSLRGTKQSYKLPGGFTMTFIIKVQVRNKKSCAKRLTDLSFCRILL